MLKITRVSKDRIDVDLSGSLDSVEMATGLDHLIAETADMSEGKMLYRIRDIGLPSIGALIVELERLPSLFGLLRKIDRCAVLCDVDWLRRMAEVEGAILPGLDIKGFDYDEEEKALKWLADEGDRFESVPV